MSFAKPAYYYLLGVVNLYGKIASNDYTLSLTGCGTEEWGVDIKFSYPITTQTTSFSAPTLFIPHKKTINDRNKKVLLVMVVHIVKIIIIKQRT